METMNTSAARKQPTAISRMKQDYMRLKRDPLPYITAEPLPNNILEWHYCVKGPEDSPYHGGYYHGTLLFPREFPFKPPSIYMLTPNGRFKINTRLCLSISDFHPDTWNPTWCVGTILTGLLSFMLETTPTLGSIESTQYEKQQYAKKSLAFNLKNTNFRELFPEICDEITKRIQTQQQLLQSTAAGVAAAVAAANGVSGSPNAKAGDNTNGSNAGAAANGEMNALAADTAAFVAAGGVIPNPANAAAAAAGANSSTNSYFNWQSIYSNLIIIISFAIFALIVNYVIKNINQE